MPTYDVSVEVPDAAQLVKGDDVRVGGARVGQVQEVTAVERGGGAPPVARLRLALNPDLEPLAGGQPRPGAPGVDPRRQVPGARGGPLSPRDRAGRHAARDARRGRPSTSTRRCRSSTRRHAAGWARRPAAWARRSPAAARGSTARCSPPRSLLPRLQRVLRTLVARDTDLARLLRAAAQTTGALAPVAEPLGGLVAERRHHAGGARRGGRAARAGDRGAARHRAHRHPRAAPADPGARRRRRAGPRAAPGRLAPARHQRAAVAIAGQRHRRAARAPARQAGPARAGVRRPSPRTPRPPGRCARPRRASPTSSRCWARSPRAQLHCNVFGIWARNLRVDRQRGRRRRLLDHAAADQPGAADDPVEPAGPRAAPQLLPARGRDGVRGRQRALPARGSRSATRRAA